MNWYFIMQASFSSDLYGCGNARMLINRQTLRAEFYYRIDKELAIF